jgi:hypothetical protein
MKKLLSITLLSLPSFLLAHGGHGFFTPNTIGHYLFSAEHALPMLAIVFVGVLVFRRFRKRAQAR